MSLTISPGFAGRVANTDVSTPKKIKNQREQNDSTYKYSNRETNQHRQHKKFFAQKASPDQYSGAKKKSTLSFSARRPPTSNSNIWIIEKYNDHLKLDDDVIRATVGYIKHCDSMAIALSLAQNLTKCTGKTLKYDCGPYNACLSRALELCSFKELPVQVDEILAQMLRLKVNHNDITAINLLKIYKATKNHSEAQLLVLGKGTGQSYINVWKIDLNIKICNALMGVYGNLDEEQITGEIAQEIDDFVKTVLQRIAANKALESPDEQMLPDAITANNLLGVYKVRKNLSDAKLLVFGTGNIESIIDGWEIPLNNFIYCTLFGVCANLDEDQITEETEKEIDVIVDRVLKLMEGNKKLASPDEQMLPNAITAVNLLGVYKVRKKPSAAKLLVFGKGNIKSIIDSWEIPLNNFIYNALMSVFANLYEDQITEKTEKEIDDIVGRVLKLIEYNKALESPNEQMLPNEITAVNLLGVYKVRKNPSAAKFLVFGAGNMKSIIDSWGVLLTNKIYNALMGVFANLDEDQITEKTEKEIDDIVEKVLKLIKDNKKLASPNAQMLPDAITAVNLLGIYKIRKKPSAAKHLVLGLDSLIKRWGLPLNIKICNALLGVCANLDEDQITEEIKKEIDDIVEKVLKLIKDNKKLASPSAQMLPDEITAVNLLGVYKIRKKPSAAKLLFFGAGDKESIIDSWGIPLTNKICSALLGVYANLDEAQITEKTEKEIDDIVEKVLKLIKDNKKLESPNAQMLPDAITANNLLGVYKVRKNLSAAKLLVFGTGNMKSIIDSWEIPLNNFIYCTLFGVCANLDEDQITEETEKEIDVIVDRVLKLIKDNKKLESPNAQMLPNAITAVNLLGVYKIRKKTSAASLLVLGPGSIIKRWKVPLNNKICCAFLGVFANLDQEQITDKIAIQIDYIVRMVLQHIEKNKFLELPDEQMLPNEITVINLLGICKVRKKPSAAKHLVLGVDSLIKRWGVPLNIKICNALLGACANLDEDQITEKTEKEIDDIVEKVLKLIKDNKKLESPNAQMLPNAITAVNLLGVYKIRKKTSAAKQLVFGTSNDLDVPIDFTMYANWALVGKGQFSENLNGLCARGICDSKKGLFSVVLNCHAGSIFNQLEQEDAAFAVPFEFAKALYEYHYQQNANISQIITGYRSGNKLRSQFISYFKKIGLEVQIDKNNQGVLIIPANS